jgi:hypothetical protein
MVIMKKSILILAVIFTVGIFHSCKSIKGKGEVVSESRVHGDFTGINLCIDGDVYYTADSTSACNIQAQQNIINIIETTIKDNTLIIKYKDLYTVRKHEPVRLYISAPNVNEFEVSGSGNINISNVISSSTVNLNISGSGNINANSINSSAINATINGSGGIVVAAGNTDDEALTISGSGNIDMHNLMASNVKIIVAGSGDLTVYATHILDIIISGNGNIYYSGSPMITQNISGSGTITQIP